ncbi:hypothetical protein WKI65_31740 [Streptomyces sp. MS1.AVA.3]|uniref:hypothetical protein n=1 Tax=Streptomyces decoyicus TaxID=249567 RepID=UPI0030BF9B07
MWGQGRGWGGLPSHVTPPQYAVPLAVHECRGIGQSRKWANRQVHEWRSVVDADIIGVADTSEKAVTKVRRVTCGV